MYTNYYENFPSSCCQKLLLQIVNLIGARWPGKQHVTFNSVCGVTKGFYLCNGRFLETGSVVG